MKISSDPGMVSALETWLRDSADAEALAPGLAPIQVSAGSEPALQVSNSGATTPRDSAAGLLELDVWRGVADGSRQLASSALFQPRAAEPAGAIQGWTEHIFQPLV
jgi:hypothetical protein